MSSPIRELVEGFLQSREIDLAADYIRRGRAYAGLAPDALEAAWADAFSTYMDDGSMSQETDDLGAELGLRGCTLPIEKVPAAMAMMQARLEAMGPPSAEASERIGSEILQFAKDRTDKAN